MENKNELIYEDKYIDMYDKRQAAIRKIVDSFTDEEFVALAFYYIQVIRGYIICSLKYKSDGKAIYIKCFHRQLCKTENFSIPLDVHQLMKETCASEWTDDRFLLEFNEVIMFNVVEGMHYVDPSNYNGAEMPDCLKRVKDEIDNNREKYDKQLFGEFPINSITISVIDLLTDIAVEADLTKTIESFAKYESIYLYGFENIGNKEGTQKYMGNIVVALCDNGHRVILDGIGAKSPGYECIRTIINRYVASGKVHLNPIG